jgi:hypothetical protein
MLTVHSSVIAGLAALAALVPAAAHAGVVLGAQAQYLPVGEAHTIAGDMILDEATEPAAALSLFVGYAFHRQVDVTFAPRVIVDARGPGLESDGTTQVDLAVRITGAVPLARNLDLFGQLSPGYSFLSGTSNRFAATRPRGFLIGAGAGLAYALTPSFAVHGEVGVTRGSQHQDIEVDGERFETPAETSFLHLGVGMRVTL